MKRVGLIGYGLAGRSFHAPLLQAAGFFIAAIATRSIEKRGLAHDEFPLATMLASAEELVEEELDLVVIASTNEVHAAQARLAIDAGIPVVVDKPMALDYYETLALFDYADARGVPITVFFNRLLDSDTLTLKRVIANGDIGEIFRFESRFERFRPDSNPSAWRENTPSILGGGLLLDLQTHLVSTAIDLFGPAELEFSSLRKIRGEVEDDVLLVLKHASGVDSYLSVSAISGAPGPRLRVNGRTAALIAKELDPQEALLRAGVKPLSTGWQDSISATSEFRIYKGSDSIQYKGVPGNYVHFYNQVRDCLEGMAEMPVAREFALDVARILDRAREIDIHQ
ncbi:MAG: Gfo/Idh/MocA family oxidoreductase [Actinomycetota bacterium]